LEERRRTECEYNNSFRDAGYLCCVGWMRGEAGEVAGMNCRAHLSLFPSLPLQPAAHLQEDFPLVASYLRTITNEPALIPSASDTIDEDDEDEELDQGEDGEGEDEDEDADMSAELSADNLSSLMAERLTEDQTSLLMEQFAEVMRKCEEDGINRDEELKQSEFRATRFLLVFCFPVAFRFEILSNRTYG